jgi:hypothetical protein
MKIIDAKIHGAIDYLVVIFLWLSPTIFGLSGFVATITYALGGIHLLLTALTNFPFGIIKVIPFAVHGWVELIVSIVLVASPWLLGFSENPTDRYFYIGFGVAVFATWLITGYDQPKERKLS